MDAGRFDDVARNTAALPRRRALLTLGGSVLAAALAGGSAVSADKKSRKKCKKQQKQCRDVVQDFCAGSMSAESCVEALRPCCASCNVKAAMVCTMNELSTT